MTDLKTRVRDVLGAEWKSSPFPWEGLMRLYKSDREAFYLLAFNGLDGVNDELFRSLADLAHQVRLAVRSTYRIDQTGSGGDAVLMPRTGNALPVPSHLIPEVKQFLLEIDGKGSGNKPGKDYEGRVVSEAEARFKLGSKDNSVDEVFRRRERQEVKPLVLRIAPDDIQSLAKQPAYVVHGLLKCAKRVILAPTAIYRGLKRGDDAPKRLREGLAICGKPNHAYDNKGCNVPPPPSMVYMVYADAENFVFDWDWVEEDPHYPGHPLDTALRFGDPLPLDSEMNLDLPDSLRTGQFDPSVAVYSDRGDCIFCYICNECSFAQRVNPDLTIFRSFVSKEVTGFKIKNVRRILKDEEDFYSDDAPDLTVSVQAILLATLKAQENRKTSVKIYEVIIEAFRKFSQPPEVRVPHLERESRELTGA